MLQQPNNKTPFSVFLFSLLALSACGGSGGGGGGGGSREQPSYAIGGTIADLTSPGLVLRNYADRLAVSIGSTSFTFPSRVTSGGDYDVQIETHPTGQSCGVAGGRGNVGSSDVRNIAITCFPQTTLDTQATPRSVTLTWNHTGASYNLYRYTSPNCNVEAYGACPGGTLTPNVTSPYTVTGLTNGTPYYFRLEAVYNNGRALSNEAGARPDAMVTSGPVSSVVFGADGTAYLGGNFTQVGIRTGMGVPLRIDNGRPVSLAFPLVNGEIRAAVSDGAGGWYIGGDFTRVGNVAITALAHILVNGTVDTSWNPSPANNRYQGAPINITSLAMNNGTLYVGGTFTSIGGATRDSLAALNANGTALSWNPNLTGSVDAFAVSGNTIYIGGWLTPSTGTPSYDGMYAVDTDGTVSSWRPNSNGKIYAIAISNNTIYVGGWFTSIAGESRSGFTAFTNGTLVNWIANTESYVYAIAVSGDTVYIGGSFQIVSKGATYYVRSRLAAIRSDGTVLDSWNPGADNNVKTLVASGSLIYVGGSFGNVGGQARNRLASIGVNGILTNWAPEPNDTVNVLAISGSTAYAGGKFTSTNCVTRNYLAAVSPDGKLAAWNPNADYIVASLGISNNIVYAGGYFSSIGGVQRSRLAAISTDGSLTNWNPNVSGGGVLTPVVNALAVADNAVYIGGWFSQVGSQTRNRLAAIGTDGTLLNWNPNSDNWVRSLTVSGNIVYVGGDFTSIGGYSRYGLAAIDNNGTVTGWNPNNDNAQTLGNLYFDIAASTDTVYVAGIFSTIGNASRTGVAAIGANGTVSSWNMNSNNAVYSVTLSGNTVYLGGLFTSIAGVARNRLAAVTTSGTPLSWSPSANAMVGTIALSPTGAAYVGGTFTSINDEPTSYFAIIE